METYLKNKEDNWFFFKNTNPSEGYPLDKKMDKESLKKINKECLPKIEKEYASISIIKLLDSSIKFDFNKIELIDITAHIHEDKVFGIINYIENKKHKQFRF